MTTTPAPGADLSRLRLGTAPDSWGVWFPDDPHQVPWHQFLDEVVQGGYQWIELGRGRVNVKGCVAALKEVGFTGWAIVELDRVVDPGGTPKASAEANRAFVVNQLGLTL